ncbi:MAG TPA: NAD(P)-binding protein [Gammaproteobacteria bacterium]|nr:NAD(P)-binding protein [Gammaproteobacteria bacterium]
MPKIAIIGAGAAGLTSAVAARKAGLTAVVFEARAENQGVKCHLKVQKFISHFANL